MSDDLLKRLENRTNRRSFLKGSALLAASMLVPATLSAQQAEPQKPQDGQAGQAGQAGQGQPEGQERQEGQEGKDKAPAQQAKEGDGAETFVGADGRPYRICPQCGANMYKQNRTWTCENCGYSYEE